MRSCPTCASPAAGDDRFCGRCGSPLGEARAPAAGRFCTRCGGSLAGDARFCGRCGADAPLPNPDEVVSSFAREDEDLLAEWEQAIRVPTPSPQRIGDDPAITETIVRPAPAATTTTTSFSPMITTPQPTRPAPEITPPQPVTPPVRVPAASPPQPAQRAPFRFPLGATLALVGAVAVILSAVLPWEGPFRGSLPRDIPASAILDPQTTGGISLGIVLLVAGTIGALVALLTMALPFLKLLRRLAGLLTLLIPLGFALRTMESVVADGEITDLWAALGIGVYVAAGGALLELLAGRWFRR